MFFEVHPRHLSSLFFKGVAIESAALRSTIITILWNEISQHDVTHDVFINWCFVAFCVCFLFSTLPTLRFPHPQLWCQGCHENISSSHLGSASELQASRAFQGRCWHDICWFNIFFILNNAFIDTPSNPYTWFLFLSLWHFTVTPRFFLCSPYSLALFMFKLHFALLTATNVSEVSREM